MLSILQAKTGTYLFCLCATKTTPTKKSKINNLIEIHNSFLNGSYYFFYLNLARSLSLSLGGC